MVTFVAELNCPEKCAVDIDNTCLEDFTNEKVEFVSGPEFDH